MYLHGTIRKYIDDASAGQPTPGGGSVAALAGALGVSMGCMAANFTIGKKKFRDVEPKVRELLASLESAREQLLHLMDEDTRAYGQVDAAYQLPQNTDEEKRARQQAIQDALKVAMEVPLRIMGLCRDVLGVLAQLVDIANPNLISDVGVSAVLAEAALRAARLNVDVNLRYLKDEALRAGTCREAEAMERAAAAHARAVMAKVQQALAR